MKFSYMKLIVFLVLFFSFFENAAQRIIELSVYQPPEFGFSLTRKDTTIVRGKSVQLGTHLVVSGGSGEYHYAWIPASSLNNPASPNPVATPLDTTTYFLTVTDKAGCSFTLSYTVNTRDPSVGIPDAGIPSVVEAILYPNPGEGEFKVQLSGSFRGLIRLDVYDISGRLVTSATVNDFSGNHTEPIRIPGVKGTYFIRIVAGSNIIYRQFNIQ